MNHFHWTTYDVRTLLPPGWQQEVLRVAREHQRRHVLISGHSTSREASAGTRLPILSVGGAVLGRELPWLWKLYGNEFRCFAGNFAAEEALCQGDQRFAIELIIQTGTDRYECHVDTNPIAALLYCTTHREGTGGELVVSNIGDVPSVADVDADRSLVEPKAGQLVLFDARAHSHYVRPLADGAIRVVAAMNYYTRSSPEARVRPPDLNRHLTGQD